MYVCVWCVYVDVRVSAWQPGCVIVTLVATGSSPCNDHLVPVYGEVWSNHQSRRRSKFIVACPYVLQCPPSPQSLPSFFSSCIWRLLASLLLYLLLLLRLPSPPSHKRTKASASSQKENKCDEILPAVIARSCCACHVWMRCTVSIVLRGYYLLRIPCTIRECMHSFCNWVVGMSWGLRKCVKYSGVSTSVWNRARITDSHLEWFEMTHRPGISSA